MREYRMFYTKKVGRSYRVLKQKSVYTLLPVQIKFVQNTWNPACLPCHVDHSTKTDLTDVKKDGLFRNHLQNEISLFPVTFIYTRSEMIVDTVRIVA